MTKTKTMTMTVGDVKRRLGVDIFDWGPFGGAVRVDYGEQLYVDLMPIDERTYSAGGVERYCYLGVTLYCSASGTDDIDDETVDRIVVHLIDEGDVVELAEAQTAEAVAWLVDGMAGR